MSSESATRGELAVLTQEQVCKLFQITPDTLRRLSERAGVQPGAMKREQATIATAKTEPSPRTEAPDDDDLELLTQEQVCKLFQITPDTLRAREREGKAPPRIELSQRAIRYRRPDVRAFLEALAAESSNALPFRRRAELPAVSRPLPIEYTRWP